MLMMIAMAIAGFTSCKEKNEPKEANETSTGMYVICAGNSYSKIPGGVTALDYKSGEVTPEMQDAFLNANKIEPGDLTSGLIYGSKMYLAATNSNVIWVVNPQTLKIIKQIQPQGKATSPRYFVEKAGKVYVTMFTGYVSVLDTLTLQIDESVAVGPNPERPAIAGDKLYVPNSDGWSSTFSNSSVSVIDLQTMKEGKLTNSLLVNPTHIVADSNGVFVLTMGNYKDVVAKIYKLDGNEVKELCEATKMDMYDGKIYTINAPYGKPVSGYTYKIYNARTLAFMGDMIQQTTANYVEYPTDFSVDKATGDIVVLSYRMNGEYPGYSLPGYAYLYDSKGVFKQRIGTGIDPKFVVFKR